MRISVNFVKKFRPPFGDNILHASSIFVLHNSMYTFTSRLFTHIVSTEKMRKYMRDRKDMRGTNYTYFISCFFDIASN